jgi:hypothetical protein
MSAQAPPWSARPLRHVYPGRSAQELTPGCIRQSWTSRLHLPAPLRSTGITRLHRYYGCSDSRAVDVRVDCSSWHTSPAAARVSPLHVFRLPGSPSPTTLPLPPSLWHRPSAWRASRSRGSGLRRSLGGSPVGAAESSSSSYGLPVRLRLLPTPPYGQRSYLRLQAGRFSWGGLAPP